MTATMKDMKEQHWSGSPREGYAVLVRIDMGSSNGLVDGHLSLEHER
jgi:hypothetical protein